MELRDTPALRAVLPACLPFSFGGVLVFPTSRARFVLARAVVTTTEVLAVHAEVHRTQEGVTPQTAPDAWSPHVTLSMRLSAEQVAEALPLLGDLPAGAFVGARLWDGELKTITDLST